MKKLVLFVGMVLLSAVTACGVLEDEGTQETDYGCESYATCSVFSSGLLAVQTEDLYGYVDASGEMAIEPAFEYAGAFYEDTAIVYTDEQYRLIDKEGEFVTEGYERLDRIKGTGNLVYSLDDKDGLMDEDGNILREAIYDHIYDWTSEGYMIMVEDGKSGYMDEGGDVVIETEYDSVTPFMEGLAAVEIDGQYGFIDTDNEMVIDPIYDDAGPFNSQGTAVVEIGDDPPTKKIIDTNGDVLVEGDNVSNISNSFLYKVRMDGESHLHTLVGDLFVNESFETVQLMHGYSVKEETDEETFENILFDETGSELASAPAEGSRLHNIEGFDEPGRYAALIEYGADTLEVTSEIDAATIEGTGIHNMTSQYLAIERDGAYGVVDWEGNTLLNFEYDRLRLMSDEYIKYLDEDTYRMGLLDYEGNTIIEAEYDNLNLRFEPVRSRPVF